MLQFGSHRFGSSAQIMQPTSNHLKIMPAWFTYKQTILQTSFAFLEKTEGMRLFLESLHLVRFCPCWSCFLQKTVRLCVTQESVCCSTGILRTFCLIFAGLENLEVADWEPSSSCTFCTARPTQVSFLLPAKKKSVAIQIKS